MSVNVDRPAWCSRATSQARLVSRFEAVTGLRLVLDPEAGQRVDHNYFFVEVPHSKFRIAKIQAIRDSFGWFFSHPIDLLSATVLMIQESES